MATAIACPVCYAKLALPEDAIGQRVRGKRCRAILRVERDEREIPQVFLVRDPHGSVAERLQSARKDRERHAAPSRRRGRTIVAVWLAIVLGCIAGGFLLHEFFFLLSPDFATRFAAARSPRPHRDPSSRRPRAAAARPDRS